MKSLQFAWPRAVRAYFARQFSPLANQFRAFFPAKSALKHGLLVAGLYMLPAVPLAVFGLHSATTLWASFLLALFLGLAAERASLAWDSVFSLPHWRSFCFWQWHELERTRFCAVLIALAASQLLTQVGGRI